jgi:hypothetical protein
MNVWLCVWCVGGCVMPGHFVGCAWCAQRGDLGLVLAVLHAYVGCCQYSIRFGSGDHWGLGGGVWDETRRLRQVGR